MSIDNFIHRNRLACLLMALHTLLVGAYAWIELNHAWNDMNPTMLVMAAMHVVDYPIHLVLSPFFGAGQQVGSYLFATLILGGIFWFAIGWCLSHAYRTVRQLVVRQQPMANGV